MELGLAVAMAAVKWLISILILYLLWFRFLKEKVIKPGNAILKVAAIIFLAVFLSLLIMGGFFMSVQHTLEVSYEFPAAFVYRFY